MLRHISRAARKSPPNSRWGENRFRGGGACSHEIFSYVTIIIRRISRWVTPYRHGGKRSEKKGAITYFVGEDSFFSHGETDAKAQRFAIASLISNGHVRASEVEASDLGIAYRTLMTWTRQLAEAGHGSFFVPRAGRGSTKLTAEKAMPKALSHQRRSNQHREDHVNQLRPGECRHAHPLRKH